jgi:hypothetical protein
MDELTLEWEDRTYWVLSGCKDAGGFFAQRSVWSRPALSALLD